MTVTAEYAYISKINSLLVKIRIGAYRKHVAVSVNSYSRSFGVSFKKRFGITPSQCVDNKAAQYRVRGNKGIGL